MYKEKYKNAANSLQNVQCANVTLQKKIESLKKKHHKEQAELLTKMESILNKKDEIQDQNTGCFYVPWHHDKEKSAWI